MDLFSKNRILTDEQTSQLLENVNIVWEGDFYRVVEHKDEVVLKARQADDWHIPVSDLNKFIDFNPDNIGSK